MPVTLAKLRDSHPEFIFVGEHPSIDFANTCLTPDGQKMDYLRTWADLVDWLSMTGLSTEANLKLPAARGAEALESVTKLRQAWKTQLARLISGDKVSDQFVEHLNRLLADESFHEELHRDGKSFFRLVRSVPQLSGEKLALTILSQQIAVFLAEANLSYLRRCANTVSCSLYFYDTTKNHRRQWCSAAACGNRHKVAQFRQRQFKT